MIPVDVTILAKDSCSKDIRNSRYFELLYVRGAWLSQGRAYMLYIHCGDKFYGKYYQGGNIFFGRYNIGPFCDCLFIECCNVSRLKFGTMVATKEVLGEWKLVLVIGITKNKKS